MLLSSPSSLSISKVRAKCSRKSESTTQFGDPPAERYKAFFDFLRNALMPAERSVDTLAKDAALPDNAQLDGGDKNALSTTLIKYIHQGCYRPRVYHIMTHLYINIKPTTDTYSISKRFISLDTLFQNIYISLSFLCLLSILYKNICLLRFNFHSFFQ